MRISTSLIFQRGLHTIQDATAQQQKTQLQLSTGKKVLTPADDPVASTRILELNQELALNTQFQRNIELAEGRLTMQDDLLGTINDVVLRVRELAVSAGNGSLNIDDLQFIAAEAEERLTQMAGLLNTRDAGGEFMFGGFQGRNEPFLKNASGAYEYNGDEGRRQIQIERSVSIAITENGKQIFQNVPAADNTFQTATNPANQSDPPAQISVGIVTDQEAFDAFFPEDMTVTFSSPTQFSITQTSSGRVLLANVAYTSNSPILVNGVQFEISGAPAAGDSFFIESSSKQGVLTTVEKFIYGLRHFNNSATGRENFDNMLASTLRNLDNASTSILEARSQVGARLNTIETTDEQLKDVEILTQEVLNKLEAVDYAEAVSLLSVQQFTLEAAYSSYSRITSLSLFDQL
jgi:flagellar hook-associated protein 3 FlgL